MRGRFDVAEERSVKLNVFQEKIQNGTQKDKKTVKKKKMKGTSVII